jgi:hypothetical protein
MAGTMNKNVTLAILALTMTISHADPFDYATRLDQKYGDPKIITEGRRSYLWKEYVVDCYIGDESLLDPADYFNGRCIKEIITRQDGGRITMTDLKVVLPEKSVGGKWEQTGHNAWSWGGCVARLSGQRAIDIRVRGIK